MAVSWNSTHYIADVQRSENAAYYCGEALTARHRKYQPSNATRHHRQPSYDTLCLQRRMFSKQLGARVIGPELSRLRCCRRGVEEEMEPVFGIVLNCFEQCFHEKG
jgi:hypothetical protein